MKLFLTLILTLFLVQPAMAQSWFQRMFGTRVDQLTFTAEEQKQIRDYFSRAVGYSEKQTKKNDEKNGRKKSDKNKGKKHGDKKGLPPGLAIKDTLPPGLAKQLEKNGKLPAGLAKRDLPPDLQSRLPRRHKKHERIIVGNDVILVEKATGLVLDVLRDVLRGAGS